jgi:hypothetical protein
MIKLAFAVATAAVVMTAAPLLVGVGPAAAQNVQLAQGVDIQVGPGRDDRDSRRRNDRDRDLTVGVGPGGVAVGPRRREHCRTVSTTIQRDDGRTVTRRERQCD